MCVPEIQPIHKGAPGVSLFLFLLPLPLARVRHVTAPACLARLQRRRDSAFAGAADHGTWAATAATRHRRRTRFRRLHFLRGSSHSPTAAPTRVLIVARTFFACTRAANCLSDVFILFFVCALGIGVLLASASAFEVTNVGDTVRVLIKHFPVLPGNRYVLAVHPTRGASNTVLAIFR